MSPKGFKGPPLCRVNRAIPRSPASGQRESAACPSADLAIIVTPPEAGSRDGRGRFAARGARRHLIITDVKRRRRAGQSGAAAAASAGPAACAFSGRTRSGILSSAVPPRCRRCGPRPAASPSSARRRWRRSHRMGDAAASGFSGIAAAGDMIASTTPRRDRNWFAADTRTRLIVVFMERLPDAAPSSAARQGGAWKPLIVLRAANRRSPQPTEVAVFAAALRVGPRFKGPHAQTCSRRWRRSRCAASGRPARAGGGLRSLQWRKAGALPHRARRQRGELATLHPARSTSRSE